MAPPVQGPQGAKPLPAAMKTFLDSLPQTQTEVTLLLTVEDGGKVIIYNVSGDSPTLKVALSGADAEEWMESIHDEFKSLQSNDSYDLVDAQRCSHSWQ